MTLMKGLELAQGLETATKNTEVLSHGEAAAASTLRHCQWSGWKRKKYKWYEKKIYWNFVVARLVTGEPHVISRMPSATGVARKAT